MNPGQLTLATEYSFLSSTISGQSGWFKADSLASTLNDGDPVATWADQSGNGNDATQSSGSLKPLFKTAIIGGRPVVRFDGVDDRMDTSTFTQNAAGTVFCVFIKQGNGPAFARFWEIGTNNNFALVEDAGGGQINAQVKDGVPIALIASPTLGQVYLIGMDRDGGGTNTGTAFLAGTSVGTQTGTPSTGAIALHLSHGGGGDGGAKCDIAELMIYNRQLTPNERNTVFRYLGSKYSIVVV